MLKVSSILPWLLLPVLASAQHAFIVKGKVDSCNAPLKTYLRYVEDGKIITDSAALHNGAFRFAGTATEPFLATLTFHYGTGAPPSANSIKNVHFYLEKGVIDIVGTDSLKQVRVKGGRTNADNQVLEDALAETDKVFKELDAEYFATPEAARKDEAFAARRKAISSKASEQREAALHQFFATHTQSMVGLSVLQILAGSSPDYEKIQPLFAKLAPEIRATKTGKAFGLRLERTRAVLVGNIAPDFTQNDPAGKPVSLASFRGKYVLIDFWASWCGPCRAENPHLVKAYNTYKDKNFTVLGVSLDQPNGKEKWLKAIQDDNLTWTQVSDLGFWRNEVAQLYAINSIPQNFLLDPKGVIIARNLRGEALAKKLEEVIK